MLKIAHRGDSGSYVENSLLAFEKAIELGADGIELDIWKCKSGEIVVFHDQFLERMTVSAEFINEKTFAELKELNLWYKGEQTDQKIPTLEEVFDLVKQKAKPNFKIFIELKGPDVEEDVVSLIEAHEMYDHCVVISFRHERVLKIKAQNARIRTAVLLTGVPVNLVKVIEKAQADDLVVSYKFINFKDIDAVRKRGHQVFIYTVNDKKKIEKVKLLQVDGIFSDYCELLNETLGTSTDNNALLEQN